MDKCENCGADMVEVTETLVQGRDLWEKQES